MHYICIKIKTKRNNKRNNSYKMATKIKFIKMQGAGNDYIYVNSMEYPLTNPEELSIRWSAYHTGIGSDGLVLIGASDVADFSMRIFNADGSEAMMCGNASRCIGKYLYENKLTDKKEISLETLSGIKILKLHTEGETVSTVTVDMGMPVWQNKKQINTDTGEMIGGNITIEGKDYTGTFVSMGNPHFVIFTPDVMGINLTDIGPKIEHSPMFPERVNVEFAQVMDDGSIRMRVWERGSGITMACGTGACATTAAAIITKRARRKSTITMDGGSLEIEWSATDGHIYMTGPATKVFEGEIEI